MADKFKSGDRVQMTSDAYTANPYARSYTGVIVRYSSRDPERVCVRVKRDGIKTVETWHENAWEPRRGQRLQAVPANAVLNARDK